MMWIFAIGAFAIFCMFPIPTILAVIAFSLWNQAGKAESENKPSSVWFIAALIFAILCVVSLFTPFASIYQN